MSVFALQASEIIFLCAIIAVFIVAIALIIYFVRR